MHFLDGQYIKLCILFKRCENINIRTKNDIYNFNYIVSLIEGTEIYQLQCRLIKRDFIKIPYENNLN